MPNNDLSYFIAELKCLIIQARNRQMTLAEVGEKVEAAIREAIIKIGDPKWNEFERLYQSAQNNAKKSMERQKIRKQAKKNDKKLQEVHENGKTDKKTKRAKGA